MHMPKPDPAVLGKRQDLINELGRVVSADQLIIDESALRVYETDGLTAYRQLPLLVVLPDSTQQVAQILRLCSKFNTKVVPRGAGTSLSGGTTAGYRSRFHYFNGDRDNLG